MLSLKCIKVANKLRVRITSPGYFNEANCQFPSDIRVEGRIYEVPVGNVSLITSRNKWYYKVSKIGIKILTSELPILPDFSKLKIFEDSGSDDCAICMVTPKCMIIVPCGHFYTCKTCTTHLKNCPICRTKITNSVDKLLME